MRYRRRSAEFEVFGQINGIDDADGIKEWLPGIVTGVYPMVDGYDREGLVIRSKVGNQLVPFGYWLVRSAHGGLTSIDPETFDEVYEPVPDALTEALDDDANREPLPLGRRREPGAVWLNELSLELSRLAFYVRSRADAASRIPADG